MLSTSSIPDSVLDSYEYILAHIIIKIIGYMGIYDTHLIDEKTEWEAEKPVEVHLEFSVSDPKSGFLSLPQTSFRQFVSCTLETKHRT